MMLRSSVTDFLLRAIAIFTYVHQVPAPYLTQTVSLSGTGEKSFGPILDPDAVLDQHHNTVTSRLC